MRENDIDKHFRVKLLGPLWILQQRKRILFIPWSIWKTIFVSHSIDELKTAAKNEVQKFNNA